MKLLIAFMALISLYMMFFLYQNDMNQYLREQSKIKSIAEECAAGASLYFDETAFSQGYFLFDKGEAEEYVKYILEHSFPQPYVVSYEIEYREGPDIVKPGIGVTLTVQGRDWFRLGFLSVTEIKRKAFYEQKGY